MSEPAPSDHVERIVVALDASPQSVSAFRIAAELAALMGAEVQGVFVEDVNLLNLCDLPYGCEVGSYSGTVRRVDVAGMERQLRVLAARAHAVTERAAARTPVRWSFRVRRGVVVDELLAAADGAALLGVGRAARAAGARMGSTAQSLIEQTQRPLLIANEGARLEFPLTVLYTGSAAAQRALSLALRLARREAGRVRIAVWRGADEAVDLGVLEAAVRQTTDADRAGGGEADAAVIHIGHSEDLLAALPAHDRGTLVLPREHAALFALYSRPMLLVP